MGDDELKTSKDGRAAAAVDAARNGRRWAGGMERLRCCLRGR
jgi:hypothetical protein